MDKIVRSIFICQKAEPSPGIKSLYGSSHFFCIFHNNLHSGAQATGRKEIANAISMMPKSHSWRSGTNSQPNLFGLGKASHQAYFSPRLLFRKFVQSLEEEKIPGASIEKYGKNPQCFASRTQVCFLPLSGHVPVASAENIGTER